MAIPASTLAWLDSFFGPFAVQINGVTLPSRSTVNFKGTYGAVDNPATGAVDIELAPLPTGMATGDLLYYDGTAFQRIPVGTAGQVLTMAAGLPAWAAGGGGTPPPTSLDPDTLAWMGAWGPTWTASPWVGKHTPAGSTGTVSGGRNAAATVNSPNVGTINGFNVPLFNGSNTDLNPAGVLGDYIADATGLCSGFVVFNASTAITDDPVNPYVNPPLIGENAGVWNVSYSTAGFGFSFTTAAGVKRAVVPRAVSTPTVGLFRFDGAAIEVSIDGVTWIAEPATWAQASVSASVRTPYIGRGNSTNFNGTIGEVYITNTALTRTQLAQICTHRKTKFAVT